jgi:hypothetical protein
MRREVVFQLVHLTGLIGPYTWAMENDVSAETRSETGPTRPTFILRVIFLAPLIVAAFGLVGFLRWTVAGWPLDHTLSWLALTITSVCWAFTHWAGFLRRECV